MAGNTHEPSARPGEVKRPSTSRPARCDEGNCTCILAAWPTPLHSTTADPDRGHRCHIAANPGPLQSKPAAANHADVIPHRRALHHQGALRQIRNGDSSWHVHMVQASIAVPGPGKIALHQHPRALRDLKDVAFAMGRARGVCRKGCACRLTSTSLRARTTCRADRNT